MGVWIEIPAPAGRDHLAEVTPCVGVWIEIADWLDHFY